MTDHKAITDAELHECKGAAGASTGEVPVSDGAGSAPFGVAPHRYALTVKIDDISTAKTEYVAAPYGGTIDAIYTTISGALATADPTITTKINTSPVTNGAITITQSGSAAGDIDSATPTAANTVVAGDLVTVETDGASTNTIECYVTLIIGVS